MYILYYITLLLLTMLLFSFFWNGENKMFNIKTCIKSAKVVMFRRIYFLKIPQWIDELIVHKLIH